MKKILFFGLALFTFFTLKINAQTPFPCTIESGVGCLCPNGADTCDLIPDINIAKMLLLDPTQNPEMPGELRISVATPNVGYGVLEILSSNFYVCGTDTLEGDIIELDTCQDGTAPRQLIKQRIYQKKGDQMTYYDRWAGSMTYHPIHGHMHVDAWCNYTIRKKNDQIEDPFQWEIVAAGTKMGYCLMDYTSCNDSEGYCVDDQNIVKTQVNTPNYGMGGGDFDCSFFRQGISVGFADIYHYDLAGMDIQIPEGTCNGDYYLLVQVDPNNNFLEMNENNNTMLLPLKLEKQNLNVNAKKLLYATQKTELCEGESINLSTNFINSTYLWNTGSTDNKITVTQAGKYWLSATTACNDIFQSDTVEITMLKPIVQLNDTTTCIGSSVSLTPKNANENTEIQWFATQTDETPLFIGNTFETPALTQPATYYVQNKQTFTPNPMYTAPLNNTFGSGGYQNFSENDYHLKFNAFEPFTLKSVKVYAQNEGERTIELRDSSGAVLQSITLNLPEGESRATLNFQVPKGVQHQLGAKTFPALFRNNTDVKYPYIANGICSITGSNADLPAELKYRYYYFYDWEVQAMPTTCISAKKAVTVTPTNQNCVGIGNNANTVLINALKITPMPNNGIFTLQFAQALTQKANLQITNTQGKMVHTQTLTAGSQKPTLNLTHLPKGIYNLTLITAQQNYYQKIIIQ